MEQQTQKENGPNEANKGLHAFVFILVAIAAYAQQWDLGSLSWGIWLSEFVICAAVVCNLLWHIFFSDTSGRDYGLEEKSDEQVSLGAKDRILALGVLGFCAFCIFLLLSMYAMFLYVAFPVPVTKRTLSLLSLLLLGFETALVLLPQYWPMVLGTLLLEKDAYTGESPQKIFHLLGSHNLMKIHLSLMALPPLAFALQRYTSSYATTISIFLLLIFYFPIRRRENHDAD